jgi:alanine racemase
MNKSLIVEHDSNAWVEVDLDALGSNVRALKMALAPERPEIIAVVKADAYGHGSVASAKAFRSEGISRFAVTSLDEARALVEGGIDPRETPILVFAPMISTAQATEACSLGLETTVCDAHHARLLICAAEGLGATAAVHLKVDTGMGRLGEAPSDALSVARLIAASDRLKLTGTYTHFARAGEDDLAPTVASLKAFTEFCTVIESEGILPGIRHAANSSAALRVPESRLDAVRLGTVLYGQYPSSNVPKVAGLNPKTWQAKARVVFVHELPSGATVGYGSEIRLSRATRAAVIAIGFADGFAMSPNSVFSGKRGLAALVKQALGRETPFVYLHGNRAPVLGRVAMQMIVVDVTALGESVKEGDIADIPMRRLAANARLPRIYTGG